MKSNQCLWHRKGGERALLLRGDLGVDSLRKLARRIACQHWKLFNHRAFDNDIHTDAGEEYYTVAVRIQRSDSRYDFITSETIRMFFVCLGTSFLISTLDESVLGCWHFKTCITRKTLERIEYETSHLNPWWTSK